MMGLSGCNPTVILEASIQRERKSTPGHITVKRQKNQRENLTSSQRKGAFKGATVRMTADFSKTRKLEEDRIIVYIKDIKIKLILYCKLSENTFQEWGQNNNTIRQRWKECYKHKL